MSFLSLSILVLVASALCLILKRKLVNRIRKLEQDLQQVSSAMSQMAEIQVKEHEMFSSNIADLEERLVELSVPSFDENLPLEKRHQVLSLAQQGMPLEEIAQRLKAPVGEAELILNLRQYMGGGSSLPKNKRQVTQYA
jgi:DNA-directed RNA polymerase specialized sigma24 family protein